MKLILSLAIAVLMGGTMLAGNDTQTATTPTATAVSGSEVTPISRYASETEFVITFYSTGTDWDDLRGQMMAYKTRFEEQHGKLDNFRLVCYSDRASVPRVTADPSAAYHAAYDQFRICALENHDGIITWNFDGVDAQSQKPGKWKSVQLWDNYNKEWKTAK